MQKRNTVILKRKSRIRVFGAKRCEWAGKGLTDGVHRFCVSVSFSAMDTPPARMSTKSMKPKNTFHVFVATNVPAQCPRLSLARRNHRLCILNRTKGKHKH